MIFGLILLGALLMASALKGTEHELAQRLQADLLGTDGFIVWIAAIAVIGALGYVPGLATASNYLLALLMTVILIRNGGVWSQLQIALQQASAAGPAPSVAPLPTTLDQQPQKSGSGSSGSSGSSDASTAISTIATVAEIAAVLA